MIRKLSYVMAVVFMFSAVPIEGISQSRNSVERANRETVKHVVKRKARKAKSTIKKKDEMERIKNSESILKNKLLEAQRDRTERK